MRRIFIGSLLMFSFNAFSQNVIEVEINNQYNDVEVRSNNTVDITSSDLELHGKDGSSIQETFLRFENITLPPDAIINNAYLVFYGDETSTTSSSISISGEIGNSLVYPTSTAAASGLAIKSRSYTNTLVDWLTNGTTINQKHQSPNLKNLLLEMFPNGINTANIAFRIKGNEQGSFTVKSFSATAYRPRLVIDYWSMYGKSTIVTAVGNDDARENNTGSMTLAAAYHNLGGRTDASKYGIRFQNVQIPANAEITDAYIQFYAYATSPSANIDIYSEIGNSSIYSTSTKNISSRNYSQNKIEWTTTPWATAREIQRTPNLKNIIDENRLSGWNSGENLAFQLVGISTDRGATVYAFEGGVNYRPQLVVEYKNNDLGPSISGAVTDPSQMNQLFINELSSQGTEAQSEDWIELYNNHDYPLHIKGGVYLSDKNNNRTLSELKNIFIPAKGYTILIADSNPSAGNQHVNFGLSSSGETVYLSRLVNGNVLQQDKATFGQMAINQTYARYPNGSGNFIIFAESTYKTNNDTGKQSIQNIGFSHPRGIYPSGFDLTITAPPGSIIKYTLDGKFPSETVGITYTGPITINKTSVVKAYVYNSNGYSSVFSNSYILQNNYANEVRSGAQWQYKNNITADEYATAIAQLPIVSVSSNKDMTLDWELTSFEYIDNNIEASRSNFFSNSMGKKFGQVSAGQLNSGVKFKFNKDSGSSKAKYKFFDQYSGDIFQTPNETQTLELKEGQDGPQNNIYNLGFMRYSEKIVMNLQKEMDKYALDTRFVNLFINGQYRGVKTLRNDFKANNLEEVFGDDSDNYTKVNLQDGNFTRGMVENGDGLTSVWTNILDVAATKNLQDFKKLVDIQDLIRFQIMFMFIDTENEATAITHNTDASVMKAKLMINDTDGAFFGGNTSSTSDTNMNPRAFAGGGGNYKYKWQLTSSRNGPAGLFGKFMGSNTNMTTGNLEFKTLVKDAVLKYIGEAKGTMQGRDGAPLSVNRVQQKMTESVNELDLAYKMDAAYMGYNANVYTQWKTVDYPRILAQTPERVKFSLEKWLEYNMAHTLENPTIDSESAITEEQTISITNPNANTQVYYTTNGTDPMGNDGIISSDAKLYSASFSLPLGNYTIVTRAFTTNNWGPITEKTVVVTASNTAQINRIVMRKNMEELEAIKIYPNPVVDVLNIDLPIESVITLYNINGQVMKSFNLNKGNNKINVSSFSTGIYILRISSSEGEKTFKIIKN